MEHFQTKFRSICLKKKQPKIVIRPMDQITAVCVGVEFELMEIKLESCFYFNQQSSVCRNNTVAWAKQKQWNFKFSAEIEANYSNRFRAD